jgi:hypothetical protein
MHNSKEFTLSMTFISKFELASSALASTEIPNQFCWDKGDFKRVLSNFTGASYISESTN